MREKNTMSKEEFAFENGMWTFASLAEYRMLLFRCIPGITLFASEVIFFLLAIVFITFGMQITFMRRRTPLSVVVNIALPFEIYTAISYYDYIPVLILLAIGLSAVLMIVYFTLVFLLNKRQNTSANIRQKLDLCFHGSRTISCLCMMIVIIPLAVNVIVGGTEAFKSTYAEKPSSYTTASISENMDVLVNLRQDKWGKLTSKEKINTLQTVANIEASYLGLPHELNISVNNLGDSLIAQYKDDTHEIEINSDWLDKLNAKGALDAVCHEAYHAYECRLVDAYDSMDETYKNLLDFDIILSYKENFQNYVEGDSIDYFMQACEIKARRYAEDATTDYYQEIES